jgi:hypothetical protein
MFCWLTLGGGVLSHAADLQAGLAVVDITPPVPYRMCGYFNERLSTGVLDPLNAKALVLRQGDRQLAMVYCDLVGVSADISIRARQAAEKKTGISKDNILVACTHTHTGPLFRCALRDYFHEQAIAKHGSDPYEKIDYVAMIVERIAQAVAQAHGALRPVSLAAGVANEPGLSFNRRFHMKDGSVVFNPGKLNPNIVRVAGPIDPEVGIVLVRDAADARPLGSLTVFALHLDTLSGTLYSADFPYWLEQSLRENLGGRFISLFGNGTCGDINHINFMSDHAQPGGGPETKRIGQALAARVKAALPKLKSVGQPRLGVRTETVLAPLQTSSPEEVAWAKASMAKIGTDKLSFLDQVKAYKIMDLQGKGDMLPIFVQAFRLSDDVALVALPGEVFVELGLAIKKASPFAQTMIVELANDCPDYVPTRKAFKEGSYETVNSRVRPGGGEMAVEAAIRLLKQLKDKL